MASARTRAASRVDDGIGAFHDRCGAYRHQELRRWREFLGIPTYVFEGELFWGQDRLQMPEWRLTQKLRSPKGASLKG
jgi:2-hydroxychromene-2-carboxylate isomerase